jgi:hypothetical protein
MIPSSVVPYFIRLYPWAVANGLAAEIPPAKLDVVVVPTDSQWPNGSMLYLTVDCAYPFLTFWTVQFSLLPGEWTFRFEFASGDFL